MAWLLSRDAGALKTYPAILTGGEALLEEKAKYQRERGTVTVVPLSFSAVLYITAKSIVKALAAVKSSDTEGDRLLQGSPKECFPGLVNFVTAVAYHFCLNLPRAFSQPGKHSFGDPCTKCLPNLGLNKPRSIYQN